MSEEKDKPVTKGSCTIHKSKTAWNIAEKIMEQNIVTVSGENLKECSDKFKDIWDGKNER